MCIRKLCVITCYRDRTGDSWDRWNRQPCHKKTPAESDWHTELCFSWHLIGIFMCLTLSREQNPSSMEIIKRTVSPWHTIQNQLTDLLDT